MNHSLIVGDEFHELRHGSCLLKIIHYAHALRYYHPLKRIAYSKFDFKYACRRKHLKGILVAMAMITLGSFALIYLRLPFGGTCCVYAWCAVSELLCDVANALLRCIVLDPHAVYFTLKTKIPDPSPLSEDIDTGLAYAPDVLVDPDQRGEIFSFIDDLVVLGYYDEDGKA